MLPRKLVGGSFAQRVRNQQNRRYMTYACAKRVVKGFRCSALFRPGLVARKMEVIFTAPCPRFMASKSNRKGFRLNIDRWTHHHERMRLT
jgi:hypothetical protein